VPPSWARRQDSPSHAKTLSYEEEEVTCQTWRRKFLWFPTELGDDDLGYPQPHWPPYHGSWSKARSVCPCLERPILA